MAGRKHVHASPPPLPTCRGTSIALPGGSEAALACVLPHQTYSLLGARPAWYDRQPAGADGAAEGAEVARPACSGGRAAPGSPPAALLAGV